MVVANAECRPRQQFRQGEKEAGEEGEGGGAEAAKRGGGFGETEVGNKISRNNEENFSRKLLYN